MRPVHPLDPTVEKQRFAQLQAHMATLFRRVFPDRQAPRTVVVVPSLSMDADELAKISGIIHYEERLLCLLMLLQLPRTKVVYVTSQPLHDAIVDYYLHLLPGVPGMHARRRLVMLSAHDASPRPLTQKILERPRLLARLREALDDPASSHITCFNSSPLERTLAVRLGIPLYACDPDLTFLGNKSVGREIFREAEIGLPDGIEHVRDTQEMAEALADLKGRAPSLRKAVVKLNDGFSGEGNALFRFDGAPNGRDLKPWIARELPSRLAFEAAGETWDRYEAKFAEMHGIVEAWIDGDGKRSPSVQCRITPTGGIDVISTHDQILGGASGQVFLGCTFPADGEYRLSIQEAGYRVAAALRDRGVIGRFGVDFISVPTDNGWEHYAIEINLRKGGTTYPYLMLQFLTNGTYDLERGVYCTPTGQPRYYRASDNLQNLNYRGLTPDDLIDIMVYNELHFDATRQTGVVFHLMGALSEFGKFGVVAIHKSRDEARELYRKTRATLDAAVVS